MNELLTGGGDIQAIIVGALVVFSVFLGALGIRSSNSRRGAQMLISVHWRCRNLHLSVS